MFSHSSISILIVVRGGFAVAAAERPAYFNSFGPLLKDEFPLNEINNLRVINMGLVYPA